MRSRSRCLVCLFLSVLFLFSAINLPLILSPLTRFLGGEITLSDLARESRAAYVDGIAFKSAFVDLNGAYARLTGRRVYHGVRLLNNGMLDWESFADVDTAPLCEGISELSERLSEKGIPLLYVQIPYKVDLAGALLPDGAENTANRYADEVCFALSEHEIPVLDLRETLTGSVSDVERYYYRTDHHWNADGAFCAFGEVLGSVSRLLKGRAVDLSWADAVRWEREVYPSWMLGSHGKRVGRFFGGADDFVLYTPREEIATALTLPHRGEVREGSFLETLIRREYLDRPDHHRDDAHCAYLGGNYPLALHTRDGIENGGHVLLVKDSFSLPLEAMLSVALPRLDAIDPRYFKEETVLRYAERTRPDLVVIAINPSVFSDRSYWDFGK